MKNVNLETKLSKERIVEIFLDSVDKALDDIYKLHIDSFNDKLLELEKNNQHHNYNNEFIKNIKNLFMSINKYMYKSIHKNEPMVSEYDSHIINSLSFLDNTIYDIYDTKRQGAFVSKPTIYHDMFYENDPHIMKNIVNITIDNFYPTIIYNIINKLYFPKFKEFNMIYKTIFELGMNKNIFPYDKVIRIYMNYVFGMMKNNNSLIYNPLTNIITDNIVKTGKEITKFVYERFTGDHNFKIYFCDTDILYVKYYDDNLDKIYFDEYCEKLKEFINEEFNMNFEISYNCYEYIEYHGNVKRIKKGPIKEF